MNCIIIHGSNVSDEGKSANGEPLQLHAKGHFLKKHVGAEEFPELLEEILFG